MRKAVKLAGAGVFFIGVGLEVSGLTHLWVGVAFMVLGVGWIAVAYGGPPAFTAFSKAVVLTGVRQLPAVAPPIDTRPVREAAQRVRGELKHNRDLIEAALESRRFWRPSRRTLVASEWQACYALLAREPGLEETYRRATAAYQACDRINHLLSDRIDAYDDHMAVGDWRDLPDWVVPRLQTASEEISRAMAELDNVVDRLRDDAPN